MKLLIMNRILLLVLVAFVGHTLSAQKHVYDDLLVMYVDEDYEKCVSKGERYIDNKTTRKDPLPYLYVSKCYHEMSKREEFTSQPEYKNADREALKNAVKFRKKDKDMEYFNHHEDYWRELNTYAMDAGMNWFGSEKYSKARMIFSRMVGYDPHNPGAWQMLALCQSKINNQRGAAESMEKFHEALEVVKEEDPELRSLAEDQRKLMKNSLIMHSEYLYEQGMQDSARVVMNLGLAQFEEDPEFKMMLQEFN